MPLTSPPKSHFGGESTFTLGDQVAAMEAPDRPNELKCFNLAFAGGDCRIQITPGAMSRFLRAKSASNHNHLRHVVAVQEHEVVLCMCQSERVRAKGNR